MTDPVLHLLAGPNGAGKSTLFERVIEPVTHLRFVNADRIAAERWPDSQLEHAYEASTAAARERDELLAARRSFSTETVFSHPSKLDLIDQANALGYLITLHVVMIPAELSLLRVEERVGRGGHDVPHDKIIERWHRLWPLVADAIRRVDGAVVYDNSSASRPFRVVTRYRDGRPTIPSTWPKWAPAELVALGG